LRAKPIYLISRRPRKLIAQERGAVQVLTPALATANPFVRRSEQTLAISQSWLEQTDYSREELRHIEDWTTRALWIARVKCLGTFAGSSQQSLHRSLAK
jgi:hypothetical protein